MCILYVHVYISSSSAVLKCLACLEHFTDLRLKDDIRDLTNPLCMNTSYKSDVRSVLPNLVILDGKTKKPVPQI